MCGQLGAKIAAALVRRARVRRNEPDQPVVEPGRRDDQSLLEELARPGRKARRLHAANVCVVGPADGEAEGRTRDEGDVGEMRSARVGIVQGPDLSRRGAALHYGRDGLGHGTEMNGDVLGLHDHPAAVIEQRRRAVAPFLDVRREGRPDEHGAHLLGDGKKRAADHLELDRDPLATHRLRSSRSVPCPPRMPAQPSGTQHVAPGSSSTHGPSTGAPALRRIELEGRAWNDRGGSQGDELDLPVAVGIPVALLVRPMEAFREADTEDDLELEGLAAVAQARLPGLGEVSRFGEGPNDGDDAIPPFVARDEAERREDPGLVGNEHGRGAELVGESARVQRPRAAERDEGEVAGVVPLLHRDDTKGPEHLGVDDLDHSCGVDVSERSLGRGDVEHEPAGQDGREPAEEQIRVGHRGGGSASAVARRSRVGAGAARTDSQCPALVTPDDRAAAGPDRVNIHHRQPNREPCHVPTEAPFRLPVRDQADVRGGAAHVEGDGVSEPCSCGDPLRAYDSACRAGHEDQRRMSGGLRNRCHATRGQHDEGLRERRARRGIAERPEVSGRRRAQIRVGHRGRGALVLTELR